MRHRYRYSPIPMLALGVALLAVLTIRIVAEVRLEQRVTGHLAQAADANNLGLAEQRLAMAEASLDALGICPAGESDCYTSILWRTPSEDVRFWRDNLASAHAEIVAMNAEPTVDRLTESNQLIKLRETLSSAGRAGQTEVTVPPGLAVYPHNRLMCLITTVLAMLGFATWWRWLP